MDTIARDERADRILAGIDTDRLVGLEIGPLARPLVLRDGERQIYYADYADQAALVEASADDPNVDTSAIPEIDYLIAPLPDKLDRQFDYIVASHVGEHVPDLIGWIKTLLGWLNPGGSLVLALPDKRYTFDCYRTESTVGQLIEAHWERREKPPVSSIYDGFSKAVKADAWYLWEGVQPPTPYPALFTKEAALSLATKAMQTGNYRDCHCWVFTAQGFCSMLDEVKSLGILDFQWGRFSPPRKYEVEFYVTLKAC